MTRRCSTLVVLPLARVIGAAPAYPLRPLASRNRWASSPISARTRAPVRETEPGKLVMILASWCCSNASTTASSRSSAAAQAALSWPTLNLVISACYIILVVLLTALPSHFYVATLQTEIDPFWTLVWMLAGASGRSASPAPSPRWSPCRWA